MASQTLNTIKNWFKTGLKPTQSQFWDTWDSFRHKYEKVPTEDVDGLDKLLLSKADKVVLDEHLADKKAHAPQINTDWKSESGFSQLLNKPEFKTINGKSVLGDGNITIKEGEFQNLDEILANGGTAFDKSINLTNAVGSEVNFINKLGFLIIDNANNYQSELSKAFLRFQKGSSNTIILPNNDANGTFTQQLQSKSGTVALLTDITGGPQDLQQTLANGSTVDSISISLTDSVDNPTRSANISAPQISFFNTDSGGSYSTTLSAELLQLNKNSGGTIWSSGIWADKFLMQSNSGIVEIKFDNITGIKTIQFPDKDGTLAITEDVTLQKVLEESNTSNLPIFLHDKTYEANIYAGSISLVDGLTSIGVNPNGFSFYGENGYCQLSLNNILLTNTGFIIPTDKPDGVYTLATADDLLVFNGTNTAVTNDLTVPSSKHSIIYFDAKANVYLPPVVGFEGKIIYITNTLSGFLNVFINSADTGNLISTSSNAAGHYTIVSKKTAGFINTGSCYRLISVN